MQQVSINCALSPSSKANWAEGTARSHAFKRIFQLTNAILFVGEHFKVEQSFAQCFLCINEILLQTWSLHLCLFYLLAAEIANNNSKQLQIFLPICTPWFCIRSVSVVSSMDRCFSCTLSLILGGKWVHFLSNIIPSSQKSRLHLDCSASNYHYHHWLS